PGFTMLLAACFSAQLISQGSAKSPLANPLERYLAQGTTVQREVPVSGALNGCPEGLCWPQRHNLQSAVILRMSQENAAQASQRQPVMQATTEHQQFHKNGGESGSQEIGHPPM
ncbi:Protein Ami, partial [Dissostichus eleginoides]